MNLICIKKEEFLLSSFVKFTEEEIYQAAHKSIKEFLEAHGEKVRSSGTEWLWDKHDSVKFRGHVWYRHSTNEGGTAIDFLCYFLICHFLMQCSLCSTVNL